MNSGLETEGCPACPIRLHLLDMADLCEHARCAARDLDGQIALAVFPSLGNLPVAGKAVWKHPDGTRIRALHYSSSIAAASTLVPQGCWIEWEGDEVEIMGGSCISRARHPVKALALTAAALRARASAPRLHRT